jgi:ribosomal protein L27
VAHKKGQGSTRNGRDSPGQHRGFTLYALIDGVVKYETYRTDKRRVRIEPAAPAPSEFRVEAVTEPPAEAQA